MLVCKVMVCILLWDGFYNVLLNYVEKITKRGGSERRGRAKGKRDGIEHVINTRPVMRDKKGGQKEK